MTRSSRPSTPPRRAAHWRATRRLTAALLLAWLAVTFGGIFFARELSQTTIFGWPLSFYMVAQGIPLTYVAILAIYAWRMRTLDRRCRNPD
ncbi:DUF4212 domain-containing protein [Herminiimonas sp. CN]|uniref:DUF4212 domain-containing protein n=1 Tax=Herminiimonas sp. CN TaxID=1349818 RepID=UPI00047428EA|nr:DUF4212 domain-containing protein [Herminiimonas sp. CN]